MREVPLEREDPAVAQRRHRAVLRRRQPLQKALARVDDEVRDLPLRGDDADELAEALVGVEVVDPQAALDGDVDLSGGAVRR